MSPPRSLWPTAILISFCTFSEARVLHRNGNDNIQVEGQAAPEELRRNLAQRDNLHERQDGELFCPDDRWQEFLNLEYTPTITVTTSAEVVTTNTSITCLITTQAITQTTTKTLAQILTRGPNIAAVAEEIINSVIASGTTSEPTSTKNAQRLLAESGFVNACSCKMVDPTAAVTEFYPLPPFYATVGHRVLVQVRITETRKFTAFTTVTEVLGVSGAISSSTSQPEASDALSASLSTDSTGLASRAVPISESAVVSETGSLIPSPSPAVPSIHTNGTTGSFNSSAPVVIALPFKCPDASNKHVKQVVGGIKLDYLVYCNTQIVSEDRIGKPIDAENETACTAQCSLINTESGQDTCKAIAFTPHTDGRAGGSCVMSGPNPEYASKPGVVATVQTGISSNDNDCDVLEATQNRSTSIDTSALFALITSASFALSTPGLITQTADGGVSETYVCQFNRRWWHRSLELVSRVCVRKILVSRLWNDLVLYSDHSTDCGATASHSYAWRSYLTNYYDNQ
ncbi:hypothetical protein GQ44DRAFT_774526 [Phaeosphaeriaceae sp. PMI808]|nr:hypothetical protein GQ44DRAFT_774526 [Phaeosphaeriaceae sp. PMI808]